MLPSSLYLGHFHLPVYGICAALGLMTVLVLSQVSARRVRLDPNKVWDAVVAIAVATLVISRALLVFGSFRLFLQQPMLVLALPALNDTGLLLTSIFAAAYLRWKKLPALRFLDAMAPCAALLWVFLSLGRWAEGTREGMPWRTGVYPVELLAMLAASSLCVGLLRMLSAEKLTGRVCAYGLIAAGAAIFALDLMRLPSDLAGAGILDPVQWLGLVMIVAGCALVIAVLCTEAGSPDAV